MLNTPNVESADADKSTRIPTNQSAGVTGFINLLAETELGTLE